MDQNVFMSRDPVVRSGRLSCARFVDVDGLGRRRAVAFEHDVSWLRECHARAVLLGATGRLIEEGSTYCDSGSFLGCLSLALAQGAKMADDVCAGEGPLRIEVRLDVADVPVLARPRERWDSDRTPPRWIHAPRDWFLAEDMERAELWRARQDGTTAAEAGVRFVREEKVLDGFAAATFGRGPEGQLEPALDAALGGLPEPFAAEARASVRELARKLLVLPAAVA